MLKAATRKANFIFTILVLLMSQSFLLSSNVKAQSYGSDRFKECAKSASTRKSYNNSQYGKRIELYLRYSNVCKTKWIKAKVPVGTVIELRDSRGRVYTSYIAQMIAPPDGSQGDYIITEAVSDMVSSNEKLRVCAKHPDASSLYQRIREKQSGLPENPSSRDLQKLGKMYCTDLG